MIVNFYKQLAMAYSLNLNDMGIFTTENRDRICSCLNALRLELNVCRSVARLPALSQRKAEFAKPHDLTKISHWALPMLRWTWRWDGGIGRAATAWLSGPALIS